MAAQEDIKHPDYYQSESGVEAITVLRHYTFEMGNVHKYLSRCGKKNISSVIKDLQKAIEYIKFHMECKRTQMQVIEYPRDIPFDKFVKGLRMEHVMVLLKKEGLLQYPNYYSESNCKEAIILIQDVILKLIAQQPCTKTILKD